MVEKKKTTKLNKLVQKWESLDSIVRKFIGFIGTIGILAGAVTGVGSFLINQFNGLVDSRLVGLSEQITQLQEESRDADLTLTRGQTRLELTMLIYHSPTNVVEIERIARYYFIDLKGDWYMSQIYSEWAREYGGDTSFVTHITN